MDQGGRRKKRREKQKSDDGSVRSTLSTTSQNAAKFINSKGEVKIKKLPDKYSGKTAEQVAQAMLLNPTSPEAVTLITLSAKSIAEFRTRCKGDFVGKNHEKEHAKSHLKKLETEIGTNQKEALRMHNENAILQKKLFENSKNAAFLKGQKEEQQKKLVDIDNFMLVRKTILELFDQLDTTKHPVLPFQNLSLEDVAARLGVDSWEKICASSFNANHRAISVCNVLGLGRNERLRVVWENESNGSSWHKIFGNEPDIRTGRDVLQEVLRVRLAVYIGVKVPEEEMEKVFHLIDDESKSSLSDIQEEQEGEDEDEDGDEEEDGVPVNIQVRGRKRPSPLALESMTDEEIQERMHQLQMEMNRRTPSAEDG